MDRTAVPGGLLAAAKTLLSGGQRRDAVGRASPSRAASRNWSHRPTQDGRKACRELNAGAAALSFSVLADSAIEHYRGGFYNPAMFIAPTVSALTLVGGVSGTLGRAHAGRARTLLFGSAALTGLVGFGFHIYNISKREGGWSWLNVFYGAPVAAPLGIHLAGLFGLAAPRVLGPADGGTGSEHRRPRLLGLPAGKALAGVAGAGLLGTAAEAGILHFRGAFQDPFMYIPVTVPPMAGMALGAAAMRPTSGRRRAAGALLGATAIAGVAGMGFHAYGISRNMGGWSNWMQNIQNGPPLPAPPSFTGVALAGLAALSLLTDDAPLPTARNTRHE